MKRFLLVFTLVFLGIGAYAQSCNTTLTLPYTQSFEGMTICSGTCGSICTLTEGWENLTLNNNWKAYKGPTPTSGTGPKTGANGTLQYLYFESSQQCGYRTSEVTSACISVGEMGTIRCPTLAFNYHMAGVNVGNLKVEIEDITAATRTELFNKSGFQSSDWKKIEFSLAAYIGHIVKLHFTATPKGLNRSDIGLDEIIIMEDATPPVARCKKSFSIELPKSGANVTILPSDIDSNSTDNCSNVTLALDVNLFSCANSGTNSVNLRVTDAVGNFSTCNTAIKIIDPIFPTAKCRTDLVDFTLCDPNACVLPLNVVDNGSSDNCGTLAIKIAPLTVSCNDIGKVVNVAMTYTDPSGNASGCSGKIRVKAATAPTAICKLAAVANLDASGIATITPTLVNNGSTVSCLTLLSVQPPTASCSDIGTPITVTLTVSDGSVGSSSSCTSLVTVQDNVEPSANCKPAITTIIDALGNAVITPLDVNNGSKDNCGIPVTGFALSKTTFNCIDVGAPQLITMTVTDNGGKTATCKSLVTIKDIILPSAACIPSFNLVLTGTTSARLKPFNISDNTGTSDNCILKDSLLSKTIFTVADLNVPVNVFMTVMDASGNAAICPTPTVVTLSDLVPPTAKCKLFTISKILNANGEAEVEVSDINNGSLDNLGIAAGFTGLHLLDSIFDCTALFVDATAALIVTDVAGNDDTCFASIHTIDNLVPIAICKNPANINLDATGNATVIADFFDGGTTDNCDIDRFEANILTFSSAMVSPVDVILTAFDVSGNSSTCNLKVNLNDVLPPNLTCVPFFTIDLDNNGTFTLDPLSIVSTFFDNIGVVSLSATKTSYTCADAGLTFSVLASAKDAAGNIATCPSPTQVEVLNSNLPDAICDPNPIQLEIGPSGGATLIVDSVDAGSVVVCGTPQFTLVDDFDVPFNRFYTCADIGNVFTGKLVVSDGAAAPNTSECNFSLIIVDQNPGRVFCPSVITIPIDATGSAVIDVVDFALNTTVVSDCFSAQTGSSFIKSAFTCAQVGLNTDSLLVDYDNGGQSICAFNVIVTDLIPPIAVCAASVNLTTDPITGILTVLPTNLDGGSTDNCAIFSRTVLGSPTFNCNNVGTTVTLTLQVADKQGNTANCTANVVINDGTLPVVSNCPTNIAAACPSNVTWVEPTAVDACSGGSVTLTSNFSPGDVFPPNTNTTVIYIATDGNGNSINTCQFVVTTTSGGPQVDSFLKRNAFGYLVCTGKINLFVSGNSPFVFQWNNFRTTQNISLLCPGNYKVTITDALNCSRDTTFTITRGGFFGRDDEADGSEIEPGMDKTISQDNLGDKKLNVYPNPATDKIRIDFPSSKTENFTVQVLDMLGSKSLITQNFEKVARAEISLSSLPNGQYFIKITDGEAIYQRKIVKITP